jgi:outer membrane protein OmpA-like peptidoglycan-associated protein
MGARPAIAGVLALLLAAGAAATAAHGSEVGISSIPLRPGLILVTAEASERGDYEAIYHVNAVTRDGVGVTLSTGPSEFGVRRFVRRLDLEYAHRCMCSWSRGQRLVFAGTTAFGTSAAVLADLHSLGSTLFVDMWQAADQAPPYRLRTNQAAGTLARVADVVSLPLLVDGRVTQLPALHAAGGFGDVHANFYWLDDPNDPLLIQGDLGGGGSRLVAVYLPEFDATAQLQTSLKRNAAATLHNIYFALGGATLRPESNAALLAIAALLQKNPAWRLRLAAYTDNLGGWDANLVLARARAEALANFLTQRGGVSANRLHVVGAGAADPIGDNLTVAGRALNRRIVISRY